MGLIIVGALIVAGIIVWAIYLLPAENNVHIEESKEANRARTTQED